MPSVELHLLTGYTAQDKARLGAALTDAVRMIVPAAPEAVTVMIHDMPREDYYRGGVPRDPASALPDPAETVRAYLAAMEARDLEAAAQFLAAGFVMQFPGAPEMTRLSDLIDWAKPRYRFVKKSYDRFDTIPDGEGAVVYCYGTLSGEWPDGRAFDGIRFIDRFTLRGGLLSRQDVWNDIAEVRP